MGISVTNMSGSSSYSVHYSYPSVAKVGQVLQITVVLYVNHLSGLKLFVSAYNVSALVGLNSSGFVGSSSVGYWPASTFLGASGDLYPGSHWGPKVINVTVGAPPNTGSNTTAGYVSIGLVTLVSTFEAVGAPAIQESGSGIAGPITIVGSGPSGPLTGPVALVLVAALAAVAVGAGYLIVARRRRSGPDAQGLPGPRALQGRSGWGPPFPHRRASPFRSQARTSSRLLP